MTRDDELHAPAMELAVKESEAEISVHQRHALDHSDSPAVALADPPAMGLPMDDGVSGAYLGI